MDRSYMKDETFEGTFPFTPRFMNIYGFDMHYVDEGPADGEASWGESQHRRKEVRCEA